MKSHSTKKPKLFESHELKEAEVECFLQKKN